jgi:hypothetical protein
MMIHHGGEKNLEINFSSSGPLMLLLFSVVYLTISLGKYFPRVMALVGTMTRGRDDLFIDGVVVA